MQKPHLKALIVAGEASGDTHAAKLVKAISDIDPEAEFFGSAGPKMRAAGVEPVVRADGLSIVGLVEIAGALPMFMRTMRSLRSAAKERSPDVAILIDFPEFNLRLAKHLKRQGLRIVYYISPQLWAWRQYRISTIRKYVDLVITILPFERSWYAERGVSHVEYVGSPLVREVAPTAERASFCSVNDLDPSRPIVSLLPGSRSKEISRILPTMLETAAGMQDVQFILALNKPWQTDSLPPNIRKIVGGSHDALKISDAAAIASGTATLEAAIIGTPLVVVYKTSPLNYVIFEPMIDVPHYGLVNLIAGERLAAELIQSGLSREGLERELRHLLEESTNREMRAALKKVADSLGAGGASKRAAKLIVDLVNG